jgi:hypothetical protein
VSSGIDFADRRAAPNLATRLGQDDVELLLHNAGRFETLEGTTASDVMAQSQVNRWRPCS